MEPADERPHPPGDDPWWGEWWAFSFSHGDAALAGRVEICLLPHQGTVRYWASLVGDGRRPVVVQDDEVPLPRHGSLEIRTEGLWADHVIERAFEQVTVGCEAFGLRLDAPEDIHRTPVLGERVPFGLDLEWETRPANIRPIVTTGEAVAARYELPCEVHGLVLVDDEQIPLETGGERGHGWGVQTRRIVPRFA